MVSGGDEDEAVMTTIRVTVTVVVVEMVNVLERVKMLLLLRSG